MPRYHELKVWKKSMDLLSNDFSSDEKFDLTFQIIRTAVSIPSNISEGAGRKEMNSINFKEL